MDPVEEERQARRAKERVQQDQQPAAMGRITSSERKVVFFFCS